MSSPAPVRARAPVLLALLLLVAVVAVFGQTLRFDFVNLDDRLYVTKNPYVRAGLSASGVAWAFSTSHAANWHPLTWLSLMLDATIAGPAPWIFHLTNVLLHAASTLLLFHVLRRGTGRAGRSALVAALFAVHPLHVESVAWIAERKDVLSGLLWFATLAAYRRYVEAPGRSRYMITLAFFALGLLAKPMLVTLPVVLILIDRWPLGRTGRGARWNDLLVEKVPFLFLSAVSSIVTIAVQRAGGAIESLEELPVVSRLGNAAVSYVAYLAKAVWPVDLAVLYPHPGSEMALGMVLAALAILGGITAVAVGAARSRPWLTVGWLWYAITLLPVIGIVQVGMQARADRYTYLPLVGIFLAVVWECAERVRRPAAQRGEAATRSARTALAMAAVSVVFALASAAYLQARTWRDSRTLFERALSVTEGNYLAHSAYGSALAAAGDPEAAVPHFLEAIRIRPGFVEARHALATTRFRQGRTDEAVEQWTEALRLVPGFADARAGLAAALLAEGKSDEAAVECRRALQDRPGHPTALANLAVALLREGKSEDAAAALREALRNDPDNATAHGVLGQLLQRDGRVEEAIEHFRAALRIDPTFADDHMSLANALLHSGNEEEAEAHYREAVRLRPENAGSRLALGVLLFQRGHEDEALTHLSEASRLEPANAEAQLNLGVALWKRGRRPDAIRRFEAALEMEPTNALALRYLELARAPETPSR